MYVCWRKRRCGAVRVSLCPGNSNVRRWFRRGLASSIWGSFAPCLSGILEIQTRCSLARAHMSTNTDSDLSPEVLSRLLILCNHPQVQGYRRGPRGRRGAIYISADENLSTTAISSFSASSVLEIDPIRRNSFSG